MAIFFVVVACLFFYTEDILDDTVRVAYLLHGAESFLRSHLV
jgi:hypothetical protein